VIKNLTGGQVIATKVKWCNNFLSKSRGLMFRRAIGEDEALIFSEAKESISLTSIHMFFVFFPIAVIWLDAEKKVVDKKLALPFRPYYAPQRPAQYYVEGHPNILDKVQIGDRLELER
jgi:uncharacterized membrane protein (UPF0127 family)